MTDLVSKAFSQRGPMSGMGRGPGRPWNGLVEETPCVWITWISDAAKRAKVPVDELRVSLGGVSLEMASVELTFGKRWYFRCPICRRRCEAIYSAHKVGCRQCLHLGYRSQCHRPTSAWPYLDRIFDRDWPFPKRFHPSDEAGAIVKALGKKFKQEIQRLVDQVEIQAKDEIE